MILVSIYGGIICYSFDSKQKRDIIMYLKKGGKSRTKCLVVGDGLNDVLMMSVSDVSVQIFRANLSGVHADVTTKDFSAINQIMFSYSITLSQNIDIFNYHLLWRGFTIALSTFIYQFISHYSGSTLLSSNFYLGKIFQKLNFCHQ